MPLLSYLPQRYRALGTLSRNGKIFGALHETDGAFPDTLPKTKPPSRARKGQGRAVKRDGLIFFVGFHEVLAPYVSRTETGAYVVALKNREDEICCVVELECREV